MKRTLLPLPAVNSVYFAAVYFATTLSLSSLSLAQPPSQPSQPSDTPEKSAILANDRSYEAAYAKGDQKALADFFTQDAEYTTEDGRIFSGRSGIEEAIHAALAENQGAKLTISADSVRRLAPEVLLEKGSTTVQAKDGELSSSLYTAIYVNQNGKWKISQLIESPQPAPSAHERLSELEWLLGDWEEADKTSDLKVRSHNDWARGGNFITRSVTVQRGGQTTLEGWQIIGWDPVGEYIRSWTFDGEGGFAEGSWTRDGQRWLLREAGFGPDGSRTSAEITMGRLSPDRFSWEANNRTLDGEPQPQISRIEITRAKTATPTMGTTGAKGD